MTKEKVLEKIREEFEKYDGFSIKREFGNLMIKVDDERELEFSIDWLNDFIEELGGEKIKDWETKDIYEFDDGAWGFNVEIEYSSSFE